jgi:hypothetical protein
MNTDALHGQAVICDTGHSPAPSVRNFCGIPSFHGKVGSENRLHNALRIQNLVVILPEKHHTMHRKIFMKKIKKMLAFFVKTC